MVSTFVRLITVIYLLIVMLTNVQDVFNPEDVPTVADPFHTDGDDVGVSFMYTSAPLTLLITGRHHVRAVLRFGYGFRSVHVHDVVFGRDG
jgi:hypothetical protein